MQATCPDNKTGFLASSAVVEFADCLRVPLAVYWSMIDKGKDTSSLFGRMGRLSICDLAGQPFEMMVRVVMFSYTKCFTCSCRYIYFQDLLSGKYFSVGVCDDSLV